MAKKDQVTEGKESSEVLEDIVNTVRSRSRQLHGSGPFQDVNYAYCSGSYEAILGHALSMLTPEDLDDMHRVYCAGIE